MILRRCRRRPEPRPPASNSIEHRTGSRVAEIGGGPALVPPSPLTNQPACKPGFVWRKADALHVTAIPLERRLPGASSNLPGRQDSDTYLGTRRLAAMRPTPSLFGFAPGGVCRAACVAADAVRSYRTISPLPRLTLHEATRRGGLFSVALSLGSPPPDVIRHRVSVEPGLSSPPVIRRDPDFKGRSSGELQAGRPSGHLTQGNL